MVWAYMGDNGSNEVQEAGRITREVNIITTQPGLPAKPGDGRCMAWGP